MQTNLKRLIVLNHYYLFLTIFAFLIAINLPFPWSVIEFGVIEPAKKSLIKPDVGGVISEVMVKGGDVVQRGEVLARISDPEIALRVAANETDFERLKKRYAYVKEMHRLGYASDGELVETRLDFQLADIKQRQSKSFNIVSPIDGTILTTDEFDLRVGDKIDPGTIIATVADTSRMRMKIRVHEHNISRIQIDNDVRIYVNAYPSMLYTTMHGRVSSIEPQAQMDSTGIFFIITVSLEDASLRHGRRRFRLLPGMAGYAKIIYDRSSFFSHAVRHGFDTFAL